MCSRGARAAHLPKHRRVGTTVGVGRSPTWPPAGDVEKGTDLL